LLQGTKGIYSHQKKRRGAFAGRDNDNNQRVNYESMRAALAAFGLTTAA
jgi:hypothetical protein